MKHSIFRIKSCSWLLALLLVAPFAPLAVTGCANEHTDILVTLESNHSRIIAAINDVNASLSDKLSAIEKAVSDGLAGDQEAMALIQKAVKSLTGTVAEKLAAIESAVKAQTTNLETKLGLIEAAVKTGFADSRAQQTLLQQAIESLGGTMAEKLAAVEEAVKAQTTSFETKLGLIEAAVKAGLTDTQSAQTLIKASIEALGGKMKTKLAAIDSALVSQTTDLGAKLALIETAVKEGFAEKKGQDELIQQALESLTGTVEEKLAALEEAVQSQTSSLETKLELIEAAVSGGLADGKEQLALIQQAVAAMSGDVSDQLSDIKAAIGSQTTSLNTKLGLIEAAVQGGEGSPLELIQQALESLDGTVETKLEAIETAIGSQSSSLETKLDLIEEAVNQGIASEVAAQALIQKAIETLGGNLEDKLAAIDTLIGNQTKGLELKLQAIADAAKNGLSDSETAQKQIQEAIKSLKGTLEDKLGAIDTVLNKQTTSLEVKLGLIEGAVSQGFLDSQDAQGKIQQVLTTLDGTAAEKLVALQGAITAQTTTLAGKMAAIEGALATGFVNESGAIDLIRQALVALHDSLGDADNNLKGKIGQVIAEIRKITEALPTAKLTKALDDILQAVKGLPDYTDILTAFLAVIESIDYGGSLISDPPQIIDGHAYMDMGEVTINGVKMNLKWATCNIGAENPWDYGDYFAWAETAPKTAYTWSNYSWMNHTVNDWKGIIKYTFADDETFAVWYWYKDGTFIGDGKTSLADYYYVDDAAHQQWGGDCHIPTDEEWSALRNLDFYSWEWKTDYKGSGISGMLVTRKAGTGPCAGNSIFLPAAGYRDGDELIDGEFYGFYWSSALYTWWLNSALTTYFNTLDVSRSNSSRCYGLSVRPVIGESLPAPPIINGHEYVDMGPVTVDGVVKRIKMATCNVGAKNPWDYGDYFAWGETTTKSNYDWSTYFDNPSGDGNTFTKYALDKKTQLDLEDDAANALWGSPWRTPTNAEWTSLLKSVYFGYTWTDNYQGTGVAGMIVTSDQTNNSIFLPAAGAWDSTVLSFVGSSGEYWSSSLYEKISSKCASHMDFDSGGGMGGVTIGSRGRLYGLSVRPIIVIEE